MSVVADKMAKVTPKRRAMKAMNPESAQPEVEDVMVRDCAEGGQHPARSAKTTRQSLAHAKVKAKSEAKARGRSSLLCWRSSLGPLLCAADSAHGGGGPGEAQLPSLPSQLLTLLGVKRAHAGGH